MDKKILDFATLSNLSLIEQSYEAYLEDPESVDASWRHFFEGIAFAKSLSHTPATQGEDSSVEALINNWRRYGHFLSTTNPLELGLVEHDYQSLLGLEAAGFKEEDLTKTFSTPTFQEGKSLTLEALIAELNRIYCGSIGFEFMGYTTPQIEQFITSRIENSEWQPSSDVLKKGLAKLTDTEVFEEFLNKKYPGQKRFSIEGCATLIPLLDHIFTSGAGAGAKAFIIGMAHRGRLSVLANLMQKPYEEMFAEFDPSYMVRAQGRSGDVKYHMGYETSVDYQGQALDLLLCANPSHLESVDPVALGRARALQDQLEEGQQNGVCPILVHGDASIAGQGIVYETMQMLKLKGYTTQGTLHIVVNNQVGFTATAQETQSMHYTTDLAKAFSAPVFHVNAEDTKAVLKVAELAMQVRQAFKVDVIVEIVGYRKYGHNEGDEPAFTQPVMYRTIRQKKPIRELFKEQLIHEGVLDTAGASQFEQDSVARCEAAFTKKQEGKEETGSSNTSPLAPLEKPDYLTYDNLKALATSFCTFPESFDLHRKMKKVVQDRLNMVEKGAGSMVDWGMAETLAMALLLRFEKLNIRLSGQDSMRGTFAHRHACFFDQTTNEIFTPLTHLSDDQARFEVYNALLSEYGALGFEYGYAINNKDSLAIWEAQFGDFANAAQIIIDQYIASGYQKWGEVASLMLFLPHGYEGQGPEHSSARIERFLQLAANKNMDIFLPSTAAAYFQAILSRRGRSGHPCIIFTPKALLRFAPSLASTEELLSLEALPLTKAIPEGSIEKLILCSGKVVYDLQEARGDKKIAIVTLEQLYPFPEEAVKSCLDEVLTKNKGCQVVWVQEEHQNMGCWEFVSSRIQTLLPENCALKYVGRSKSASTAAGSKALHQQELNQLIKEAME